MLSLLGCLIIFILGFLSGPILILLLIGYAMTYGSTPIGNELDLRPRISQEEEDQLAKSHAASLIGSSSAKVSMSGWLTVRRQFKGANTGLGIFSGGSSHGSTNSSTVEANGTEVAIAGNGDIDTSTPPEEGVNHNLKSLNSSTSSNLSTTSTLVNGPTAVTPTTHTSITPTSNPSSYTSRFAQTYRQVRDRQSRRTEPIREQYFCRLKGSVLFMYENETSEEALMAITVEKYGVGMEKAESAGRWMGKDAEMFGKRNGIVLRLEKDGVEGLPLAGKEGAGDGEGVRDNERLPWFLFSKPTIKTEDWYLALLQVSAAREKTKSETVFSQTDMKALIDTIDTGPDVIPMRWFNALFGRIFLSLYQTEALEQFIMAKIQKKLAKLPLPGALSPVIVREVNVGRCPPIFSKPMLKDLTIQGSASDEIHVSYQSRPSQPDSVFRITISTVVTIPTGISSIVVPLVLAVMVKSLDGNLLIHHKPPPSNRIWYGFTSMPKIEMEIVPVLWERKLQIGWILKLLEKSFRDGFAEAIVLPNMDDLAHFVTTELPTRGGIFDDAGKHAVKLEKDVPVNGLPQEVVAPIGVDVSTTADDQGESKGLRRRNVGKTQSVDIAGSALQAAVNELKLPPVPAAERSSSADRISESGPSIPRTETAPPILEVPSKKSSIIPTFKWPGQLGATGAVGGSGVSGSDRSSSGSSASGVGGPASGVKEREIGEGNVDAVSEAAIVSRTAKIEALPIANAIPKPLGTLPRPKPQAAEPTSTKPTINVPVLPSSASHTPIVPSPSSTMSTATQSLPQANPTIPHPEQSNTATSSTASLISSFRTRDKKAIASQLNSTKDAMKKWGTTFAAKRRAEVGSLSEEIGGSSRSNAVYRPPDLDEINVNGLGRDRERDDGPHSPKTLKERLDIAAREAAGTADLGRARSGSGSASIISATGSKAHRSASPSISQQQGSSPPQWSVPATRPTTGLHRDEVSSSRIPVVAVHGFRQEGVGAAGRRGSNGQLVNMQPSAGRSMVVPRVIKRPGEVTGIGSSSDGLIRRVSSEKEQREVLSRGVEANGLGINGVEAVGSKDLQEGSIPLPSTLSTKTINGPTSKENNAQPLLETTLSGGAKVEHALERNGAEDDHATRLNDALDTANTLALEKQGKDLSLSDPPRGIAGPASSVESPSHDAPVEDAPHRKIGDLGNTAIPPRSDIEQIVGASEESECTVDNLNDGLLATEQSFPPPHQRTVSMSAEDALRRVAKRDEEAVRASGSSTPITTPSAVMEEES